MNATNPENPKNDFSRPNRVIIVGCKHITASNAYSLLMSDAVDELILIGRNKNRLLNGVKDLTGVVPFPQVKEIRTGDFADATEADIVIIADGAAKREGETWMELLGRNVALIRRIMRKLTAVNFNGIILMTTNPVDILAHIAGKESGLPFEKVIGSGTVLDTQRLRSILGSELGIEAASYRSYVTGQDKNAEVATWCASRFGGMPLVEFCDPNCLGFPVMLERVSKDAVPEIRRKKNYSSFAVSTCVSRICEAILRDEHTILPVSTMTRGEYETENVYMGLPCVIGREGVERIVELPMTVNERKDLLETADLLKRTLRELENNKAAKAQQAVAGK